MQLAKAAMQAVVSTPRRPLPTARVSTAPVVASTQWNGQVIILEHFSSLEGASPLISAAASQIQTAGVHLLHCLKETAISILILVLNKS